MLQMVFQCVSFPAIFTRKKKRFFFAPLFAPEHLLKFHPMNSFFCMFKTSTITHYFDMFWSWTEHTKTKHPESHVITANHPFKEFFRSWPSFSDFKDPSWTGLGTSTLRELLGKHGDSPPARIGNQRRKKWDGIEIQQQHIAWLVKSA